MSDRDRSASLRLAVVGPTHPYKGGVASHTTELCHELAEADTHLEQRRAQLLDIERERRATLERVAGLTAEAWETTYLHVLRGPDPVLAWVRSTVLRPVLARLPEDDAAALIDDGDPEIGHFSPWSWWPVFLAGSLALTFMGLAISPFMLPIGAALVVIMLVGWVFEYWKGPHAL